MNIITLLQWAAKDARLTCGSRWMAWDETYNEWVVYERRPYAKHTAILYRGDNEERAVSCLAHDD